MGDYRKLQVWDHSHRLAVRIYSAVQSIPRSQRGDVVDQLRRCSVSVPANIVEGCGIGSNGAMLRHLRIALGSANELEYLLLFCRDGKLIDGDEADALVMEANANRRMLAALINRIAGKSGDERRDDAESLEPPEEDHPPDP